MKKYGVLLLLTLLLCGGFMATGSWYLASIPTVSTMVLKPQTAHQFVYCMGTVKRSSSQTVKAEQILWIEEWAVEKGDTVEKGDVLCHAVPIEEDMIAQYSGLADSSALSAFAAAGKISLSESGAQALLAGQERISILSPIDGCITDIQAQADDVVNTGESLCGLASDDNLVISANVSESHIGAVQNGQDARLYATAFPDTALNAQVTRIASDAVSQTSTTGTDTVIETILTFSDKESLLKPGYRVRAEIITESAPDSLLIPAESICYDSDQNPYVLTVENGNTATMHAITLGKEYAEGVQVTEGLTADSRIILNPNECQASEIVRCTSSEGV